MSDLHDVEELAPTPGQRVKAAMAAKDVLRNHHHRILRIDWTLVLSEIYARDHERKYETR